MSDGMDPQSLSSVVVPGSLQRSLGASFFSEAPQIGQSSFKETLLNSLEEVNRLQMEASAGIQQLATGETTNMAEVFSTVRKADIAFSMLMEMRNKLVEAYREIQQMRV